jgi:hypothetical protein
LGLRHVRPFSAASRCGAPWLRSSPRCCATSSNFSDFTAERRAAKMVPSLVEAKRLRAVNPIRPIQWRGVTPPDHPSQVTCAPCTPTCRFSKSRTRPSFAPIWFMGGWNHSRLYRNPDCRPCGPRDRCRARGSPRRRKSAGFCHDGQPRVAGVVNASVRPT